MHFAASVSQLARSGFTSPHRYAHCTLPAAAAVYHLAGNQHHLALSDALHMAFVEGCVVMLKYHPIMKVGGGSMLVLTPNTVLVLFAEQGRAGRRIAIAGWGGGGSGVPPQQCCARW